MGDMIFIKGNVPSSKNGKIYSPGRGAFNSKACQTYLKTLGIRHFSSSKCQVKCYKSRPNEFKQAVGSYFQGCKYPIVLGFHFVRYSNRIWDFSNISQIIQDLLTAHRFIEDDNINCLVPFPMMLNGRWYTVDKTNPGVYLKIL